MALKIVVDSSSGLSRADALAQGLYFIPLSVTVGEKTFSEGVDITADEFYKLIAEGPMPKTAQPSPKLYLDVFEEASKDGADVLLLSISSKVSGAFQAATLARSMCHHPEKIHLFDTLSFFGGIRIMLGEVLNRLEEPIDELVAYLTDLREKIRVFAGMDTLDYVYKGGRLSKFHLAVGIFLHAKPIGTLDEGSVVLAGKAIGTKGAMKFVIDRSKAEPIDFAYPCYLFYSSDRAILDRFSSQHFYPSYPDKSNLPIIQIDPLIGSHIGPLVYGIFYVSVEKDKKKRSLIQKVRDDFRVRFLKKNEKTKT
ncbi:MAG: DegV family protein [Bacilli bacterium]|jgi:DegV family protein with EDD domain|nr:DegV family protein [Bacilli bacterium]